MLRSLKVQIYLLVFIPFILIAALGLFNQLTTTNAVETKVSDMTRENIINIEKKRLVTIMESVHSIIASYIAMPGTSGMNDALALINTLKYDEGTGYIFSYDTQGIRVQHTSGKGIGDNFLETKDKEGNYLIKNIINAAKDGSGFSSYYFIKPGDTQSSPKYAYSIFVPTWDVVISTGFYIDDVDAAIKQMDSAVDSIFNSAISESLILFIAAFAIVSFFVHLAITRLYRPLNDLRASVSGLAAGEGDLTTKLPASRIKLLDDIAIDFNVFISAMAADIRSLKDTTNYLNDIASLSSEQQVHLEDLSNQQKNETVQVAAAIDEMSSTSLEIANTAEHTRESASSVEQEMHGVLQQVNVSNEQLEDLNKLMVGVEGSINELGDNVSLIHAVLSVIQGLSDQTNLLALNAAIEAARAGEYGRGFAVVADEVRNLARRSQESTLEIQEILDKLQSSVERTVQDMSKSDKQRIVVTQAMGCIREIIGSSNQAIERLSEMNIQVATAASQQSAVSSEIAERINGIASLADNIGNSSSASRTQFASLEQQSQLITKITNKFTV
jgi:methyl-accepting chemotaxis protein